jgi:hypothetical protein
MVQWFPALGSKHEHLGIGTRYWPLLTYSHFPRQTRLSAQAYGAVSGPAGAHAGRRLGETAAIRLRFDMRELANGLANQEQFEYVQVPASVDGVRAMHRHTRTCGQISPQQSLAPALAQGLLEKAAALLSRFLSVVPVQGSLFVARGCSETWDSGPHAGACRTLAVGAPRCGPTPHVPAEHVGPAITLARGQAGDWIATQHAGGAGMVRPRARSLGAVPKRPCASTRAVSSRGRRRAQTCSCTSPPSTRGRAPPRARWRMRRRASATRTTALWWSVRLQRPAVHTAA